MNHVALDDPSPPPAVLTRHHDPVFVSSARTFDEFLLFFVDLRNYSDSFQLAAEGIHRQEDEVEKLTKSKGISSVGRCSAIDGSALVQRELCGPMTAADLVIRRRFVLLAVRTTAICKRSPLNLNAKPGVRPQPGL